MPASHDRRRRPATRRLIAVGLAAIAGICLAPATAVAQPTPPARDSTTATLVNRTPVSARHDILTVRDPATGQRVRVEVLHPRGDAPRPTLYLLDGIDAGVYTGFRNSGWTVQTDIVRFMADKNVNVVMPIGGTASYYTDWLRPDPVLGVNRWESFLTEALPPLIDATYKGNGADAIGGLSMGATSAMVLTARHPDLYRGVMALSGCFDFGPLPYRQAVAATVATRGGNYLNMWGPLDAGEWAANDPARHLKALVGKPIYIAVGNGLPDLRLGLAGLASPVGGFLESAAESCTRSFQTKATRAGVKATYDYRSGLHSWGYWARDLPRAWPTIAKALDIS
ncbi:alpha/beta hydrolase [Williamsia deligens]|uniref:Alpha/beta hydrolase n=1 Tax=Williamsia deligens TaxID=321325 RepID=A0ABW3G888_9NOCA|nr:alpha/beta hydrolase family protein [Williamsia deligens]